MVFSTFLKFHTGTDHPELLNYFETPKYFTEDWMKLIRGHPDLRWLYIGPKNTFSLLHIDVLSTSAWLAQFQGKVSESKELTLRNFGTFSHLPMENILVKIKITSTSQNQKNSKDTKQSPNGVTLSSHHFTGGTKFTI
jgi:hypothetical protein